MVDKYSMTTSMLGQTLGKYRIDAEIGRGGMGIVYRGYDPDLRRPVAIKVLPVELTYDAHFVGRFQQEAILAASLRHPLQTMTLVFVVFDNRKEADHEAI